MISYFEQLLKSKTAGTSAEILYNQWMFDKKLVAQSSQAILAFFPHYSLHDESHSMTILDNVCRLLGSDFVQDMTAIDIWLMLESAYYHDIGMVITAESIDKVSRSADFIQFFKSIRNDTRSSLNIYTRYFDLREGALVILESTFSLAVIDSFKFLVAEYFRSKHGKRSEMLTQNPESELGLKAPRVIIPKRIFCLLSEICSSHTKDFQEVLNLPYSEVGINTEDAHPRFIACLLRLGDLLDIDNNRFSEVLLRTVSSIPLDSFLHREKHLSISRFRCDTEFIEIYAKCNDYNVSTLVQQWFDCLNSEYVNCMLRWNQVVPKGINVDLPTLGELVVDLDGYEYIDGKVKPSFSVDPIKALDLLGGVGLYKEPYQCIRELLQNAVDSTLVKIWLDNPEIETGSPANFKSEDQYRPYDIYMSINKLEEQVDSEQITWRIAVTDRGIGLSKGELKYIEQAGSSYKNKARNAIIDEMPEWMKPSGIFGIGFQSIFSITDEVRMHSKSFLTDEVLMLELYSPRGINTGDIRIRKIQSSYAMKHGAVIDFDMTVCKVPETMSINFDGSYTNAYARTYDPIESNAISYEISKIIDEVFRFNEYSYIPVRLSVNDEEVAYPISQITRPNYYYDKETGIEILINKGNRTETYYRGQYVNSNLNLNFLGFVVNILRGKATDILTFNRNEIKSSYKRYLVEGTLKAIYNALCDNFDDLLCDHDMKLLGSMFIEYYRDTIDNSGYPFDKYKRYWENHQIDVGESMITIQEMLQLDSIRIEVSSSKSLPPYIFNKENQSVVITVNDSTSVSQIPLIQFLFGILGSIFTSIKMMPPTTECKKEIFQISKESNVYPVDFEQLVRLMTEQKKSLIFGSRTFIPCIEKYKQLRIKDDAYVPYISTTKLIWSLNIDFSYPKMLSPYSFVASNRSASDSYETKLTEKLYDYVYHNRYDACTTRAEIISAYKSFVEESSKRLGII